MTIVRPIKLKTQLDRIWALCGGLNGNGHEGGEPGPKGEKGDTGEPGVDGQDGLTAYELAVSQGFNGTLEQWLLSLVGSAGDPGADGEDGQNGEPGEDGQAGSPGANGTSITAASGVPTGTAPIGTLYINADTGDLYRFD